MPLTIEDLDNLDEAYIKLCLEHAKVLNEIHDEALKSLNNQATTFLNTAKKLYNLHS